MPEPYQDENGYYIFTPYTDENGVTHFQHEACDEPWNCYCACSLCATIRHERFNSDPLEVNS